MTPYTKKIVELHKIHKAIEEKDCCNGGGNTPSGDITIDDVVKFIHDNWLIPQEFPYTKYSDIPYIPKNMEFGQIYIAKGDSEQFNNLSDIIKVTYIFNVGDYNIAEIFKPIYESPQ